MSQSTSPSKQPRRTFLKSVAALSLVSALPTTVAPAATTEPATTDSSDPRKVWLSVLEKLAYPVLTHLAAGELRRTMPIEQAKGSKRESFTHLEAFGRLMSGIAPWLAAKDLSTEEAALQAKYLHLAQTSLAAAVDPASPDRLNFSNGSQALVDTAFLAQAILRAPSVLWTSLDAKTQQHLIDALTSSRAIPTPTRNNWAMFAATIEAALLTMNQPTISDRLEASVSRMLSWYKGDGLYGDGEFFHADYYNSFVIGPMLIDTLAVLQARDSRFVPIAKVVQQRAVRAAEILERLIAPDGSFPCVGRSMAYRFGAFHLLSQVALQHLLPKNVQPAQVRCALTAVMNRMISAPGTFDANGWLQIGFVGHQPQIGETYISTGSLYLCSTALLPLGLPPSDPFWSDPPMPWTSQQIWSGQPIRADHALPETPPPPLPPTTRS